MMPEFKTILHSDNAPAAIGCYSQGVRVGNLIFLSGQIALDPSTQTMKTGGADIELHQIFKNMLVIITTIGLDFSNIVKLTVYLRSMAHFSHVNDVMKIYFKEPYPARVVIEVAGLPREALVEVEAILVAAAQV